MKRIPIVILSVAALVLAASSQQSNAAANAFDNASAYAYNGSWDTGDNGGYGFGNWTLTSSGTAGQFVGNSVLNADGSDDGTVGGTAGDNDINTALGPNPDQSGDPDPQATALRAWGMYANGGSNSQAFRPFTGGNLSIGQSFRVDIDNGYIESGGTVGIGLLNSGNTTLWEIYFTAGDSHYRITDSLGTRNSTIGYTDEGLNINFTLTATNQYSAIITTRGGAVATISGNLVDNPSIGIDKFRAYNFGAGGGVGGAPRDFFVNSMEIIPEPSAAVLAAAGTGLALLRRRR